MLSIMESVSRVCVEALKNEWVSPLTIFLKEEEMLAELDCEIDMPCVVQWGFLWFPAPSRLNIKLHVGNTRISKYHEVTNLAVEAAIKAPYGGRDTPRTCLLWPLDKVLDGLSAGIWTKK